jgi:hypothetical protein
MFKEQQNSLGALDGCDAYWAFSFLQGTPWEEQFEPFDAVPPEWLLTWSKKWRAVDLFTIDDIDPLIGEYQLVFDDSSGEVWAGIHQGGDVAVFKKIPTDCANPDREVVCDFFLKELEGIGDYTVYGKLTLKSPEWMPEERIKEYLLEMYKKISDAKIDKIKLEPWVF